MNSSYEVDTVTEDIEIEGPPDEVWAAIERGDWLGDDVQIDLRVGATGRVTDDGHTRQLLITHVEPGRRVAWHWWNDEGDLSSVEIVVVPAGDTTLVRVVEHTTVQPVSRFRWQACAGRLVGSLART
jgi:uncharacterized protein YndB with AHSA1/START domain